MVDKHKQASPKDLKDRVDRSVLRQTADVLTAAWPEFDGAGFVKKAAGGGFAGLELKAKIHHAAATLAEFLPSDYPQAADLLTRTAHRLPGWPNWILTSFVERFGVEYLEESVRAMKELTRYGSCEFAIRPFMMRYTDQMMPILNEWAEDDNEHVRRLAAEGSRPRGVWMPHLDAFKKDPRPVIKLLEKLKADESVYVRKAVANNLNDISKDNPDLFLKTARRWMKKPHEHTAWIVKHAARTLVKKGHPDAMALFGFDTNPKVTATLAVEPERVEIGDKVTLSLDLCSQARKSQRLAIDYRVHYVKASGKRSAKTFKWTVTEIEPRRARMLTRAHSFEDQSTRKHHPGEHLIEVTVNGRVMATATVAVA